MVRMYLRLRVAGALVFLGGLLAAAACDDSTVAPPARDPSAGDVVSVLRSSRHLTSGCYEWRPDDLTFIDRNETVVSFAAGDTAVDFTLRDVDGEPYRLQTLLGTRPVVLIFGAFS